MQGLLCTHALQDHNTSLCLMMRLWQPTTAAATDAPLRLLHQPPSGDDASPAQQWSREACGCHTCAAAAAAMFEGTLCRVCNAQDTCTAAQRRHHAGLQQDPSRAQELLRLLSDSGQATNRGPGQITNCSCFSHQRPPQEFMPIELCREEEKNRVKRSE